MTREAIFDDPPADRLDLTLTLTRWARSCAWSRRGLACARSCAGSRAWRSASERREQAFGPRSPTTWPPPGGARPRLARPAARPLRGGAARRARPAPTSSSRRCARRMLDSLHFHAFADAAPALEELRAARLRLVVASNWDSSLPEVLGASASGAPVRGRRLVRGGRRHQAGPEALPRRADPGGGRRARRRCTWATRSRTTSWAPVRWGCRRCSWRVTAPPAVTRSAQSGR